MKPRKIVQAMICPGYTMAVADDGTLWRTDNDWDLKFAEWEPYPPLPPIEEPEGEEKE